MSKIIFLDIDGVLNTINYLKKQKHTSGKVSNKRWCPSSCKSVVALCEHFQADIVISSSWQHEYDMDQLKSFFTSNGIPSEYLLDRTPSIAPQIEGENYCRGHEIKHWLKNYPNEVTSYVIIDDEAKMLEKQQNHLVRVDKTYGLSVKEAVIKASKILE